SVVTWGDPERGGDIRAVHSQLTDVQEIHATRVAFAALRLDGTVVAWGDPERGGRVAPGLQSVLKLEATDYALAALLADGSVVCWGHPDHGGDSCA
ncbi:HERC1, partial [Symbiodinium microadriaticum]